MINYTILMDISTEEISIIKNTELQEKEEELMGDYYFIGDEAEELLILNTQENYNIANELLKQVGEDIKFTYLELSMLNRGSYLTGGKSYLGKKNKEIMDNYNKSD